MKGWKTWAGAAVMAISIFITEMGYVELGNAFKVFGMALIGVGIGHKIEKVVKK